MTGFFILVRIIANPFSNVFQKQLTQRGAHPLIIVAVVHAGLTLACLPWLLTATDVSFVVWETMLVAALLAIAGNVLLVYALREADLSVLGPVNAYKSLVSLVLAIFMIGERPSRAGVAGVLLIVAGSYFVMDQRRHQPLSHAFVNFFRGRGIQLRFAALLLSAAEAVVLKRAIELSSPWLVFVLWSMLGCVVALAATLLVSRGDITRQLRIGAAAFRPYLALVLTTGTMQLATVLTFQALQVGYSLALFQLSAVVSVLLGRRYFAESNLTERLIGSLIMAAGAALIVVFGHQH